MTEFKILKTKVLIGKIDLEEVCSNATVIYDDNIAIGNISGLAITTCEKLKNLETYQDICDYLLRINHNQAKDIVCIGGGVLLDIVGFVAATFMRGIEVRYVPTTLLSMVDASIGGKCGINYQDYKNYLGVIKAPTAVYIDPSFLDTLSKRQFNNGMAEVIKMAAIHDARFFNDLLYKQLDIVDIITRSIAIKQFYIIKDLDDKGIRRMLNFGHTIGHCLEKVLDYELLHGECISIAMSYLANNADLNKLLLKYELPIDTSVIWDNYEAICNCIKYDKKNSDKIIYIKLESIGCGKIVEVQTPNEIFK